MSSNPCNYRYMDYVVDWGVVCLLAASAGPESVTRAIQAPLNLRCTRLLQPVLISHHFHDCKASLAHASHVKWRYTKYLGFRFFSFQLLFISHNLLTCLLIFTYVIFFICSIVSYIHVIKCLLLCCAKQSKQLCKFVAKLQSINQSINQLCISLTCIHKPAQQVQSTTRTLTEQKRIMEKRKEKLRSPVSPRRHPNSEVREGVDL